MNNKKLEKLKSMINESKNIVFLGGAGVSTASGIPDYRSKNGLYTKGTPEEMLSKMKLFTKPGEFYEFIKDNMIYPDAKPNNVHYALAELEQLGKVTCIATQNVDGLHQAAGSKNVKEIHGTLHDFYCVSCRKNYDLNYILNEGYICPECKTLIRPDVVLYDERIKDKAFESAIANISKADMMIIGGTSMKVYPFAFLFEYFSGQHLAVINNEEVNAPYTLWIQDDINEVFAEVRKWIKE